MGGCLLSRTELGPRQQRQNPVRRCARWLGPEELTGWGPPCPLLPFGAGSSVCLPVPPFLAWRLLLQTPESRKEKLASTPRIAHSGQGLSRLPWAPGPKDTEPGSGESFKGESGHLDFLWFSTQLLTAHPLPGRRVTVVPHSGRSRESPRSATPRPHHGHLLYVRTSVGPGHHCPRN